MLKSYENVPPIQELDHQMKILFKETQSIYIPVNIIYINLEI